MAVVARFDALVVELWGPEKSRAWPQATDKEVARRWLADGATIDLADDVMRAVCTRMRSTDKDRPSGLAYFDRPIAEAIAERAKSGRGSAPVDDRWTGTVGPACRDLGQRGDTAGAAELVRLWEADPDQAVARAAAVLADDGQKGGADVGNAA